MQMQDISGIVVSILAIIAGMIALFALVKNTPKMIQIGIGCMVKLILIIVLLVSREVLMEDHLLDSEF